MWISLTLVAVSALSAQSAGSLEAVECKVSDVQYAGRKAVRIDAAATAPNGNSLAFVKGSRFHNGTIEVEVAGKPGAGAGAGARGFIGLAFRTGNGKYESIYLRPTNGRAPDQVRRNHSTQYHSHPDYDFARLRKESPEKYESYVDLEPGVWTKMRITVEGTKARLYVHGAEQPCLIVDDMKLGDIAGGVALWVGPGTEGYFANLKITAAGE
ncbi:hypothetical protein F183_A16250 [Bryobacterales bacterium F-183]|nr:hypothetical protein F183_A16250 [Bryobacterales bacterium F-183]